MRKLSIILLVLLSSQLTYAFDFDAKWIWKAQEDRTPYNQTIVARKTVDLKDFDKAMIRITADSYYRLFINDQWVGDGPCRAYAAHYRYDELDVTRFLKEGSNEVKILSNFFGVGVLTRQVTEAGLLAQLDVNRGDELVKSIGTDATWDVAEVKEWVVNTPKISLNMGPFENYDARKKKGIQLQ